MKRLLTALLATFLIATTLVSASSAPASATTASPYLKRLAKQMRCKYGEPAALATSAPVKRSWECVVGAGTNKRRTYYLTTYRNTARGLDEYRDFLSCTTYDDEDAPCEPGYLARKGGVLIVDQSGDSYSKAAATYAAGKTGGRVVSGYQYEG